ncbi:hypothetical protein [Catenuloplanes japonicus]|uniref:hypothetical protein n=1 Tax=Catenuloplanes japonicus TaxID=33876 RepID=UPI0005255864|nr:hypothetical protein [Catenuloplanes japonicus]
MTGPWQVVEHVDREHLAGRYEHRYETASYDEPGLLECAAAVRTSPAERIVASHDTEAGAVEDCSKRESAETRPHVTWAVEFLDL